MGPDFRLHIAAGLALALCGAAHAETRAPSALASQTPGGPDMAMPADLGAPLTAQVTAAPAPTSRSSQDMAMPDDLGAPLAGTVPSASPGAPARLSVDLPIAEVAADPAGKAVLERDLPGLCERPEFFMFKTMSLRRLASMSDGRITTADLESVQGDLGRVTPGQPAAHGAFYPIAHSAMYPISYGGRRIKQFSRSLYHRVAMVIASL